MLSLLSLDRDKNAIITGPPGSGKTILAVHLAHELSKDGKVLFVTFTKALRKYVISGLMKLNNDLSGIKVEIDEKLKNKMLIYDFIIIDETQDFTKETIDNYNNRKKRACTFWQIRNRLYIPRKSL